jgi:hypothetical protein
MLIGGGRKARSDDLPRAVNFLKNIAVLGTVEHYNESLVAGQVRLCKAFPGLDLSYVPRNVSQRAGGLNERLARFEQMCGQDLWAQLSLLNELDAQLVAAANDESARRFRALASPEKILRDFQMRVWWRVQAASARDMLGRAWNFLRRRKDQMVNAGWILVHWCRQPFRHGDIRD